MKNILQLLGSIATQTTKTQQKIIAFILKHPNDFLRLPITKVSEILEVNPSNISRLCQKIGIKNLSALKIQLAQEQPQKPASKTSLSINLHTADHTLIEQLLDFEVQQLEVLRQTLKFDALKKASVLLHKAQSVYIFGIGASAMVGLDFSHKLLRLGKKIFWSMDPEIQLLSTQNMTSKDVAFAISYSGKTACVTQMAKEAKSKKSFVISLYAHEYSPLSQIAHINIRTPYIDPQQRIGADVSRIHHLLIIDVLCALIASKNPTKSLKTLKKTRQIVKKTKHQGT